MPTVGVLALQGSFPLHRRALERLDADVVEVRRDRDLDNIDALVLPGGESTTMHIVAEKYGLLEPLSSRGREGLPMFGTCAGAILLGKGKEQPPRLGVVDIEVHRNAYGRQVDSFSEDIEVDRLGDPVHAVFIRAPKFAEPTNDGVRVLARCRGEPVLVSSGPHLLASFHPELTEDLRIHRLFLDTIR